MRNRFNGASFVARRAATFSSDALALFHELLTFRAAAFGAPPAADLLAQEDTSAGTAPDGP
jgi:hypothetical protein